MKTYGLNYLLIGLLLLLPSSVFANSGKSCEVQKDLVARVVSVLSASSALDAANRAYSLSIAVSELEDREVDEIPDAVVDAMALLLRSDQNDVKVLGAISLGYLGRRGIRALPQIREMLANFHESPVPAGTVDVSPRDGAERISAAIRAIETNHRGD